MLVGIGSSLHPEPVGNLEGRYSLVQVLAVSPLVASALPPLLCKDGGLVGGLLVLVLLKEFFDLCPVGELLVQLDERGTVGGLEGEHHPQEGEHDFVVEVAQLELLEQHLDHLLGVLLAVLVTVVDLEDAFEDAGLQDDQSAGEDVSLGDVDAGLQSAHPGRLFIGLGTQVHTVLVFDSVPGGRPTHGVVENGEASLRPQNEGGVDTAVTDVQLLKVGESLDKVVHEEGDLLAGEGLLVGDAVDEFFAQILVRVGVEESDEGGGTAEGVYGEDFILFDGHVVGAGVVDSPLDGLVEAAAVLEIDEHLFCGNQNISGSWSHVKFGLPKSGVLDISEVFEVFFG